MNAKALEINTCLCVPLIHKLHYGIIYNIFFLPCTKCICLSQKHDRECFLCTPVYVIICFIYTPFVESSKTTIFESVIPSQTQFSLLLIALVRVRGSRAFAFVLSKSRRTGCSLSMQSTFLKLFRKFSERKAYRIGLTQLFM